MKPKYSQAFIEQAVVKLLSRGDRSVQAVATDLNVNYHTAKYWIKRALVLAAAQKCANLAAETACIHGSKRKTAALAARFARFSIAIHAPCPNGKTAYIKVTIHAGATVIQFKEK